MMKHRWRVSLGAAFALTAAACTGGGKPAPAPTSSARPFSRGGTLRAQVLRDPLLLDPTVYSFATWELFRCCLGRTLLSYNGRPTDEGGADLHPDLATSMPEVSPDGLTWTFHLKAGLRYGPPFEGTEIVAGDIIRALRREADPTVIGAPGYAFYYSVIRGFDDFSSGRVSSISGLKAPDDHTLKVLLTEPTGDLGYRLSLPAAAPLPPGAADGHETDYQRFLVSSGPYMIEGSPELDFSKPPKEQLPASGLTPLVFDQKKQLVVGGSATLVRNPSWHSSTDDLRGAYADRIEIALGQRGKLDVTAYSRPGFLRAFDGALAALEKGDLDLVFDSDVPSARLDEFRSNPHLATLVHPDQTVAVDYIAINVAAPPFDDIHMRRALFLAIDKAALQRRFASLPLYGEVPSHIVPDAMEDGLLLRYHPAWGPSNAGETLAAAKAEIRLSKYDRNGDGMCDAPACDDVGLISDDQWPPEFNSPVRESAKAIGINLVFHRFRKNDQYPEQARPQHRWPLNANRWAADYPNGSDFFPFLFDGRTLDDAQTFNSSVLGATPEQLRAWGYGVKSVPSVDGRIDHCSSLVGHPQVECWAEIDHYLMDNIVPWVPFLFESAVRVVSPRVAHYSFDQFVGYPALDQIALTPQAIAQDRS